MLLTWEWTAILHLFCSLLLVLSASTSVLNYQEGREYVYRLNSTIELAGVQKFFANAEVGFVNIAEDAYGIELLLIVHHVIINPEGQPDLNGYHHDYSKWFSFLISRRGEISKVFHPPDEEEEVIMLKKGFAGMLSAKFHHQHEIEHEVHADSWSYKTEEIGREGQHNSSYIVRTSPLGVEYTKIRTSNHTKSIKGNSTYSKRITIDKELNTIHSVMMEESFKMDFSTQFGFSPHAGMRPIQAVNEFSELGLPGVFAYTADYFVFFKTVPFAYDQKRPQLLNNSTIHHVPKEVYGKKFYKTKEEVDRALVYIKGNLSCIRQQPEQGSPELSKCFHQLVKTLVSLPKTDLERTADAYLMPKNYFSRKTKPERNTIVDALIVMNEQKIIVSKILQSSSTDDTLLQRVLTSLTTLDASPIPELIDTIYSFCILGVNHNNVPLTKEIQLLSCLTFGGLIHRVKTFGDPAYAEELVQHLNLELGLHDPYLYRQKRSTMSEVESLEYDINKAYLLDAIGNAGLQCSYEYIVSHVNSTNSQWIKRTGLHALRKFTDEQV